MRILFLFILLYSMAVAQLSGAVPGDEYSEFIQEYQLTKILEDIDEGKIEKRKLIIIYNILRHTKEEHIHQQRGQHGNIVLLSGDGHMEAVYGPDGKLVKDGINDGSFNFFHPSKEPLGHFLADMHPWIIHGNGMNDPTSMDERINSYVADIEGGIRSAYSKKRRLKKQKFDERGEKVVLALFISIVEAGDAGALFDIFEKRVKINDEILLGILRGIEQGMTTVYAK